jgi:hypothetical protein
VRRSKDCMVVAVGQVQIQTVLMHAILDCAPSTLKLLLGERGVIHDPSSFSLAYGMRFGARQDPVVA